MVKGRPEINLYFYEIYKSLEFFEKDKTRLKKENNITFYDYEKNIMNNIKNILKISDIDLNQELNNDIINNTNDINSASASLIYIMGPTIRPNSISY